MSLCILCDDADGHGHEESAGASPAAFEDWTFVIGKHSKQCRDFPHRCVCKDFWLGGQINRLPILDTNTGSFPSSNLELGASRHTTRACAAWRAKAHQDHNSRTPGARWRSRCTSSTCAPPRSTLLATSLSPPPQYHNLTTT